MKSALHPNYDVTTITCACGKTFTTGSTKSDMKIDICSACHPFYTGNQKKISAGGRVDRFKKKYKID